MDIRQLYSVLSVVMVLLIVAPEPARDSPSRLLTSEPVPAKRKETTKPAPAKPNRLASRITGCPA